MNEKKGKGTGIGTLMPTLKLQQIKYVRLLQTEVLKRGQHSNENFNILQAPMFFFSQLNNQNVTLPGQLQFRVEIFLQQDLK